MRDHRIHAEADTRTWSDTAGLRSSVLVDRETYRRLRELAQDVAQGVIRGRPSKDKARALLEALEASERHG